MFGPEHSAFCLPPSSFALRWSVVRGPSPGFVGALWEPCRRIRLRVACGWLVGGLKVATASQVDGLWVARMWLTDGFGRFLFSAFCTPPSAHGQTASSRRQPGDTLAWWNYHFKADLQPPVPPALHQTLSGASGWPWEQPGTLLCPFHRKRPRVARSHPPRHPADWCQPFSSACN
jgi:hypothetical protein